MSKTIFSNKKSESNHLDNKMTIWHNYNSIPI